MGKETKNKEVKSSKKRNIALILLMAFAIIVVTISAFISNYAQYTYSLIHCGNTPIALRYYDAPNPINYSKPGDADYPSLPNLPSFIGYVCTEQQAKDLGGKYNPSGGIVDQNGNRS